MRAGVLLSGQESMKSPKQPPTSTGLAQGQHETRPSYPKSRATYNQGPVGHLAAFKLSNVTPSEQKDPVTLLGIPAPAHAFPHTRIPWIF